MLIVYVVLVFCTLLRWGCVLPLIVYVPWATRYSPTPAAASLAGLYASHNCSGPNELQTRLRLLPGLNLDATARTICHYPRYCSTRQSSLNATFLNASFLSLQGFSASNCSGNVTYSAGLALALPSTSGGLDGCLAHASGSALFLPNYNDPEATPLGGGGGEEVGVLLPIISTLLLRQVSLYFLLLALLAVRGRHVELVDNFKVELEPWEAARASSASPLYLAAALVLFGASQALFAVDYFAGEAIASFCRLQTITDSYSWYLLSLSVEFAALLALSLYLQLARLARNGVSFGGSILEVIAAHVMLSCAKGQTVTLTERAYRLPCTVSTSAATLAVTLCCVISAATTLSSVLAQPAGVLHPTSRALALAGTGALCCALALLSWGCWASRGVTGVGCQRGLLAALQSEPPRYASPQDLTWLEIVSAQLWAALERRVRWVCAGGRGSGSGSGGAAPELYLLHLGPLDTQARLASCYECWKGGRPCPGGSAAEGQPHSLRHTCGICLDSTRSDRQWMALVCAHLYHAQCILQWVRFAHGSRTAVACPLDQVCVTRRARDLQPRNSWSPSVESCGRYWLEHAAGSAGGGGVGEGGGTRVLPVQGARYYTSGSRRVSVLPSGAILMAPVTEEAEAEEGAEGGGGRGQPRPSLWRQRRQTPVQPPQRAAQKQPRTERLSVAH